jgi:hypothetical protein
MVEKIAEGTLPERWTASTAHADMWMDPADDPRETETELGDERSVLVEYVRLYRLTLEMKCAGLDARCRRPPCRSSASSGTWPTWSAIGSAG